MTTSIKNIILFAVIIIGFASCSTDGIEEIMSANNVTERVDIKITGDTHQYINEQSQESDATMDLVDFNFYGNTSNKFGFEVRLDNDLVLRITIQDDNMTSPWEQEGVFDVFAAQELNDKTRFVIMDVIDNSIGEVKTYSSNNISNSHAILNAFSIVEYNNTSKEILCRIDNVDLVDNSTDNTITINGTFKGAINF